MHTYIIYGLLVTIAILVIMRCRKSNDHGLSSNAVFYDIEIWSEEKEGEFPVFIAESDGPAGQIMLRKETRLAYPPPLKSVTGDIKPLSPKPIDSIFIRNDNYFINFDHVTYKLEDMKAVVYEFLNNGWFIEGSRFTQGAEKLYDPDFQHTAAYTAMIDRESD
ncbi:MAG: hypothetical protein AB2689_17305 [Candidatus Thiodiazotropha taylori]